MYNRYVLMFEPELLEPMTKAFGYDFTMFLRTGEMTLSTDCIWRRESEAGGTVASQNRNEYRKRQQQEASVKIRLSILELITAINEMYKFFYEGEAHCRKILRSRNGRRRTEIPDPILYRER